MVSIPAPTSSGSSTGGSPTFIDPAVAAGQGYGSPNYHGSYEEYLYRTSRTLAERYMAGDQSMLDNLSGSTGRIGQPSRADFGSGAGGRTGTISYQTYDFFERYVREYGNSDPYLTQQFGGAPSTRANWVDPNAADRASQERIASGHDAANIAAANASAAATRYAADASARASNYAADKQYQGVALRVGADIQIATMEDATRRYIAEGDWGVQKYVAELNNQGAMDRLKLELGMRDKELAQRAIEETHRYQVALGSLALEVAKYDSELAANPRNWIAYAAWLGNRGMVINGLNLATAAQLIPENAISPNEIAGSSAPGMAMATVQQASTVTQSTAVNQDGTPATTSSTAAAQPTAPAGTQAPAGTAQAPTASTTQSQLSGPVQQTPVTQNYADIARNLLGINVQGQAPPSQGELQSAYAATNQATGFRGWQGATTNQLGMTVNPMGQKEDYRRFTDLLPSAQDMRIGAASSVGKYEPDFVREMQRSRPKGNVTGTSSWG